MPKVNFDEIPDSELVAEGDYKCTIEYVEEKTARTGAEMWSLRLRITEGMYKGETIWDNLVFSGKAINRVKILCKAAGVATKGSIDLQPKLLTGKSVIVNVFHEAYQGQMQAKVPFRGYSSPDSEMSTTLNERMSAGKSTATPEPEGELPF